jgi:hypothetical protein
MVGEHAGRVAVEHDERFQGGRRTQGLRTTASARSAKRTSS